MKTLFKNMVAKILAWESQAVLRKYKPTIIAVTGSVGKTSTKDAIYTALASSMFVRRSEKSFNSEIGVPLTILGCKNGWSNPFLWLENILKGIRIILFPYPYPKILVLEVGADRPGDIAAITKWLKPDIAVVTRIGDVPVHVEFFKNRAELIEEKSHLVRALKPGGTLILNGDDADVLKFKDLVHTKTIVVSVGGEGDLVASHDSIVYESHVPIGMTCKLAYEGNVVPLTKKGVLGMHQIYPMLAAVGVAVSLGVNIVNATRAFEHEVPTPGRMRIFRGVKDSIVIDDSYNASPVAVEAALRTLKEIKTKGRKIAMLGDMLELGKHSRDEHVRLGKLAVKCVDILVTVGVRARSYAEGALQAGMNDLAIMQYEYSREAGKCVEVLLQPGDVVLVKGSQGIRMEHAVKEIMAEPEKASVYLVRQDVEWEKR